jgi:hypothetical protein
MQIDCLGYFEKKKFKYKVAVNEREIWRTCNFLNIVFTVHLFN